MEQFSHDLTLALEETSRIRAGHYWGGRRRTRSTGNLPCAPQPTEDSSSQGDGIIEHNECQSNSILSDSDDRPNFQLVSRVRQACFFGNFESDSLNENFSPTRPSTRRKRKFKRMAVEYETTPSTPGNSNSNTLFPLAGNVPRRRVLKHTCPENFRAGLFFCGKRKRSHRDRYHDYDHYRVHSSSVPRQREYFTPRNTYLEYRNRNRSAYTKPCERILPLTKTIVSKIEKISQHSAGSAVGFATIAKNDVLRGFTFGSNHSSNGGDSSELHMQQVQPSSVCADVAIAVAAAAQSHPAGMQPLNKSASVDDPLREPHNKMPQKSGSFDTAIMAHDSSAATYATPQLTAAEFTTAKPTKEAGARKGSKAPHHKRKQSKRRQIQMQIQFGNPMGDGMDCGSLNDFLSSSSLSSSDSEGGETNESDREGDDELTDWPGNEAMVNFASKNDFKRAKSTRAANNQLVKANALHAKGFADDLMTQDEDTLMSADELPLSPSTAHFLSATATATSQAITSPINVQATHPLAAVQLRFSSLSSSRAHADQALSSPSTSDNPISANANRPMRAATSMPINIVQQQPHNAHLSLAAARYVAGDVAGDAAAAASNHFFSSPNVSEVREIRAGCRRVHNERPGYSIFSSVNEHLSRFLQDSLQTQLILPYMDGDENDKLVDLAKLYSLRIEIDNDRAIFYKTINTTQSVKVDQTDMPKFFLSDYKRRCYGVDDDSESTEMAS